MNTLPEFLPAFMHFSQVETTNLILLLGFILLFGTLGGRLFQKLKIPQVIGYIVTGILIGQSGFQILSINVITALNPLSSIALSLIGFMIGGELKIPVIKKYGKQFAGILFFESVTPFVIVSIVISSIVFVVTRDAAVAISLGLILGAVSSATAPAETVDVLRENRTRGPLTTTILGIIAMDDAVALILYTISASIAANLLGVHSVNFAGQIVHLLYDIIGSIALGGFIGFLLSKIMSGVTAHYGRILGFALGTLLLSNGITTFLKLDAILVAMALGFFIVNFAPAKNRHVFSFVDNFTPPIYVLFFVLVGAKLNIWNVTAFVGFLSMLYLLFRIIGKSIGATFGAWLTHAPLTVQKYLPFCLLSQAGVAIGLAISAGHDFSDTIGPTVILVITTTTFMVHLIGPVCVNYGVKKSGECNLNITEEDLWANTKVVDILWDTMPVCSSNSPTIVCETSLLKQIIDSFSHYPNSNYAVKANDGTLVGIITLESLKESLIMSDWYESLLAIDIMLPAHIHCSPQTTIKDLFYLYSEHDCNAIPIIDEKNNALGIIEKNTVEHFLHQKLLEMHRKAADI